MSTTQLDKAVWQTYFDQFSRNIGGQLAQIEIDSLSLGNQTQAKWVPLFGITYDKKNDLIEVLMEDLDHMIRKPCRVYVEQNQLSLSSLEIIDDEDTRQIIKLRSPLTLPPIQ